MKSIKHKAITITVLPFKESGAKCGDEYWKASTLYDAARIQKCRVYRLPIEHLDLSTAPFNGGRIYDYVYHAKRILNTDLNIPVIVGPLGGILDGWHRVGKALLEGKTFVKAMRLKEMPHTDKEDN